MVDAGLTKDAGWEVGVRTTVAAPLGEVWEFVVGPGLQVWLGDIAALPATKGDRYETADGVTGTIRSFTENVRVRVSWMPSDWPHETTLQISTREAATGTTIAIHHDRLANRDERRLMLGHWKNVAAAFDAHFA